MLFQISVYIFRERNVLGLCWVESKSESTAYSLILAYFLKALFSLGKIMCYTVTGIVVCCTYMANKWCRCCGYQWAAAAVSVSVAFRL